ncbi:MFS transporter [Streptomyces flavidovirens]|uniref:MFS transporter n=1 Tax=Streptomyces flavidovirens TaxID=67298 RepID=UPI0033B4C08F
MTTTERLPSPLRVPAFRSLWLGETVAGLGFQSTQFLLPLLALTAAGSSATGAGLVSAAQFVPVIVFSLVAGATVGRVSVKVLLITCNVLRGLTMGVLGIVAHAAGPGIGLLMAVAFVVGALTVFHDIGHQAAVPHSLAAGRLTEGNGLLEASYSVAQMAGPAVAGYTLQEFGLPATAAATAVVFTVALLCFLPLRLTPAAGAEATPALRSVLKGLRFTWRHRALRDLCVQSALFNLHEQALITAFMVFAVRSLGLSSGMVGVIVGLGSVGALAGSLWVGRYAARLHVGAAVTWSLTVSALSLLAGVLLALTGPAVPALAGAFVVNGLALAVYNVYALSLRGVLAPPERLGVVMAGYRLVSMAPIPLGAVIGGALAQSAGPGAAMAVITASLTLASFALRRSPLRRIRRLTDPAAESSLERR